MRREEGNYKRPDCPSKIVRFEATPRALYFRTTTTRSETQEDQPADSGSGQTQNDIRHLSAAQLEACDDGNTLPHSADLGV